MAWVIHVDASAAKTNGFRADHLFGRFYFGAHFAKTADIDIDRAGAELATAWSRCGDFSEPRQKRTSNEE